MNFDEWNVVAENDECVHITIKENIDINGLELVLLNETRTPIIKMKINTRNINICTHTEKPMFAQIGHSVKYVKGSGGDFYKEISEFKN